MDYTQHVRALASVIANIAPEIQLKRAAESCTYSRWEYRRYEQFMNSIRVYTKGATVWVTYGKQYRTSPSWEDSKATSLIERGLELLEGSPYEIPLEAGLISWDKQGRQTSYQAS